MFNSVIIEKLVIYIKENKLKVHRFLKRSNSTPLKSNTGGSQCPPTLAKKDLKR